MIRVSLSLSLLKSARRYLDHRPSVRFGERRAIGVSLLCLIHQYHHSTLPSFHSAHQLATNRPVRARSRLERQIRPRRDPALPPPPRRLIIIDLQPRNAPLRPRSSSSTLRSLFSAHRRPRRGVQTPRQPALQGSEVEWSGGGAGPRLRFAERDSEAREPSLAAATTNEGPPPSVR